METLILSKQDVSKLINMKDAIASVEQAYKAYCSDQVIQPPIVSIDDAEHNGEIDIKTCYSKSEALVSIKCASGYWDNPKRYNMPTLLATIILLDGKNGYPLCIMDGSLITSYRTGAAGGLSARLLAKKDSKKVAVIGAGNQARLQIKAISEVVNIESVSVWDTCKEFMNAYKNDISALLNVSVETCGTSKEAVMDADIIVTTTPSRKMLVMNEWVKSGTHIIAIGADMKGKQEIDPKIFCRSKIYVDSVAQCVERGEIQNAIETGDIEISDIYAELGEVLLGNKEARTNESEVTIFDSTGMGIQDNTLAALIYQKALSSNVGTTIKLL
ncbi:ornithine cyclodeaminase family protein [Geosporobacter ferrireducens]|uniref:Ornithine cyclodeaminase family protein n=1 Tax=Geosporobacter ferrireducens TaxID=1424294 RepID=A0A1D8GEH0_9FIRM|nr:ornithine cyclodeaminase family protein [Geosporobacter ferrireducens]AOT69290.1 hypothetical protein Gferi_06730 [Geosporobacter ferrireducens]MTI56973.1 ornithine cyclodeaminase family protein [Geosporobacter ferrireducens]